MDLGVLMILEGQEDLKGLVGQEALRVLVGQEGQVLLMDPDQDVGPEQAQ